MAFPRSGATISTGLLTGVSRQAAERFSFALAVVLTPPVVVREAWRLFKPKPGMAALPHGEIAHLAAPGLVGMVFSFLAGLLASALAVAMARNRALAMVWRVLPDRRRGSCSTWRLAACKG